MKKPAGDLSCSLFLPRLCVGFLLCATGSRLAAQVDAPLYPTSDSSNANWQKIPAMSSEFNGTTLDSNVFYNFLPLQFFDDLTIQTDGSHQAGSTFVPANSTVSGGELLQQVTKDTASSTYFLPAISTKRLIRNGYIEISAKVANAALTSAFWLNKQHTYALQPIQLQPDPYDTTFPIGDIWVYGRYPFGSEIDIFEINGNSTYHGLDWSRKVNQNSLVYADLKAPGDFGIMGVYSDQVDNHTEYDLAPGATSFTAGYHTFGLEWDDVGLKYYVDGVLTRTTTAAAQNQLLAAYNNPTGTTGTGKKFFGTRYADDAFIFPLQAILDVEYFPGWHGPLNEADLPATTRVKYLQVWQKRGGGSEMLTNGDFASSTGWNFALGGTASGSVSYTGQNANVTIGTSSGSASDNITLRKNGMVLLPNTDYSFSYEASASRHHWFTASVRGSGTAIYCEHREVAVSDGPLSNGHTAIYSHTFKTPATLSGSTADVIFELGGMDDPGEPQTSRQFILDNVSVKAFNPSTPSNLIVNGAFPTVTAPWVYTNPGGGANMALSVSAGQALISGTSGGTDGWHSQLQQENISLNPGNTYRLSFNAKRQSGSGTRPLQINVSADNGAYFFGESSIFNVPLTQTTYTYDFTPLVGTSNARITFFAGNSNAAVLIDDVTLTALSAPPPSSNIVVNGGFASGTASWVKWENGGATGVLSTPSGELLTQITAPGTLDWHLQVAQENLAFVSGRTYNLTFKAKAASPRTIGTVLSGNSGAYFYGSAVYSLTTTMQTFSTSFTTPTGTSLGILAFFMGGQSAGVTIDDVSIQ